MQPIVSITCMHMHTLHTHTRMRIREDDATHAGCSTRHRIRRPLLTSVPRVWPTVAPRRLQCFVDAYDRRIVYLDVAEPLSFYFDLFLITFMLGIALAFAVCIAYQHRNALMRALRAGRHASCSSDHVVVDSEAVFDRRVKCIPQI